jgi:Fe-S-cluster containining protein
MPLPLPMRLTREAATHICMHECRAQCCRGPLYLRLTAAEVIAFTARAAALGIVLKLRKAADGSGSVSFLDHPGARCPMLDDVTSACRIYEDRPERCRRFPDERRPDCPISGAVDLASLW